MDKDQLLALVEQLSRICDDVEGSANYMDDQNWQSTQRDLCKWATQMGVALDGLRCGLMEVERQVQAGSGPAR